ncbi:MULTISPECIES: sigma-70 family RNA polymerase sigma factor [unclassified Clostridioides]|uniref:sigma-70 family RNA polymerase sigma factor n=1 Tax=unclassified Clostridioides TaxID=2635829 RepID=UPI001D0CCD01|nr:sigma-70 family RNA polymerase sigma factor [Clostridioides sp. ES-S-0001-02]MCC0640155.1 sigma-70 family RNA polymerase sigma factor [Clostridioides sp. ES-S-0049-03]MCC0652064.1 sigma-70 family RNA polymerase sigma factor [Clostridioides sp. ES-S-0001-03]MCC0655599.1 sigma-70 family RNA polymerase sigma factor [Clostridioides sp. ES-S-0123-01]MCC0673279.1 sigma-70 family RNA polymerase sigma factor [Clostridioides sp. ES-S-0145-01]MCC0674622.1 sigma-70 family RNA polymerase sigma factor [
MFKSLKRRKVERYIIDNKDSFYRIAYSYTKNEEDALDVVQEAMYKALYSVENLKEVNYIKTWFYKILVRTSIDFIRKNRKYNNMTDITLIDETGECDKYTDLDLKKALEELPIEYKSIIILRFFEDLKIEEVAIILDENVNTVKTRLYTALKKLKLKIEE